MTDQAPSNPILQVTGLAKRFTLHERGQTIQAFKGLAFQASLGSLTAMVGASGSGKSSALKCVYRTYLPDAGEILYTDSEGACTDLACCDEQTILALRQKEIRLVGQFLKALPRKSAVEVVARPLREQGVESDLAMQQAREMLQRVNLPSRLFDLAPSTFSGGERQLVNLARELVVKPRLLLLDEPTASLDPRSTDQMVEVIASLKHEKIAMIAVFHNKRIVETLADHTVTIEGGVVWDSPAAPALITNETD